MAEETSLTGGCQCGAVRYRFVAMPGAANVCHCRMCQKASGGPFMAFAGAPLKSFEITRGTLSVFESSEIAERGFCAQCGTPLTYRGKSASHVGVTLGSLDNPNAVVPETQLGVESRVGWLAHALALPDVTTTSWLQRKGRADAGSKQHPDHET